VLGCLLPKVKGVGVDLLCHIVTLLIDHVSIMAFSICVMVIMLC
jgi:hypothetical protein